MQTSLIRRTKGLANDQMRMMCAVIATVLLLITYSHQHNPQTTVDWNLLDHANSAMQTLITDVRDFFGGTNYNDKGITVPSEVGSDFLLEAGIESAIDQVSVREREMFVETSENTLKLKRERAQKELAIQKQLESITCDPTDITKISNLTKEQITMMVKDTWLEGKEDVLYQAEQEHQVNVFFICAVSTLESSHGTSFRAEDRNNYYGMEMPTDFGSFENNTLYWADMMNRKYIDNKNIGSNIHDIAPVYCPPNPTWPDTISGMMNDQYKKICALTVA